MNKRTLYPALSFLLFLAGALASPGYKDSSTVLPAGRQTLVLYDAAWGDVPGQPLMGFLGFPRDSALLTYADGATVIDTAISGSSTYAGWVASGAASPEFPILDRTAGFQVDFTIQVEHEAHTRDNRAGFSLIVLGEDARGIELAFWEDEVWVQNDSATGGLFSRGEGVPFSTTAGQVGYRMIVMGDMYTLTANGEEILSGPVRDYGSFDGFPDPYETPNFLFLGDNTTSAQARVRLQFVAITGSDRSLPSGSPADPGTISPQPGETPAHLPDAGQVPSPTPVPAGNGVALCPSGWLFPAVLAAGVMAIKTIRRRPENDF